MDRTIKNILNKIPQETADYICKGISAGDAVSEIRLRADEAPCVCINGKYTHFNSPILLQKDLENIFLDFCNYSVHSFDNQISAGFITLEGGHRIGIGGKYSVFGGNQVLSDIYSLNIRLAQDKYFEVPKMLFSFQKGLLIIGVPHSGKTTLLRSLIKKLENDYIVGVCDERGELYSKNSNCDYLCGINKTSAIEQLTRTMSPNIIICDEIGNMEESRQILSAVNAGVRFICTAHSDSLIGAKKRPNIQLLIENGVFDKSVTLYKNANTYKLGEITDV